MNVFNELKEVIDVQIVIDEEALANKLFDLGVMPVLEKLTDVIPTEFDDMLLATQKENLRGLFLEALKKGVDVVEKETGLDLDGKEE